MIANFIGKLHIITLHLPIGILLLGVILEWFNHLKWIETSRNLRSFAFGLGSISAIFVSLSGFLLFTYGDYNEDVVWSHKISGFITTILSLFLFSFSFYKENRFQKYIALLVAISITLTGHLGGSITHGEGFLTNFSANSSENDTTPIFEVDNIEEAQIYSDLIQPIIDAKCVGCHGPNKVKGKLRLDSEAAMMEGGKSRKEILGPNKAKSELLRRVLLPLKDEKHMPPKSKRQVTEDELSLISWWIENGASFTHTVVAKDTSTAILELIDKVIKESHNLNSDQSTIPAFLPDVEVKAISTEILNSFETNGIIALPAGKDSPFLEINFVNVNEITNIHRETLNKVAENIVRLKWSELTINDEDLVLISKMKNLLKLHIDHTNITDQGLQKLKDLNQLMYINLNNTKITNQGIEMLNKLPNLKEIFTFETQVTLDTLQNGAKIFKGGYQLEFLPSDTQRISEN